MSLDKNFGRDPAPSAIRYLVLLSALAAGLTAFSFLPRIAGASTSEADFYNTAIPIFSFFSVISVVEWFFLGRSRKMTSRFLLGPYGFAFVVEAFKTIALSVGERQYITSVENASTGDFRLLFLNTLAIIVMLGATKFLRTRIEEIAQRDISRHALNLLPSILVLLLFMGTYVTEIAGLGTPRQKGTFTETYTDKDIVWDMFNTPSWDATYLLENLLDQFTAGLSAPETILFNVSNIDNLADETSPPVYWRLGTLDTYTYPDKSPFSTDWDASDVWYQTNPASFHSQSIDPGDRDARFEVEMLLDHNTSAADVTIHSSFPNVLPSTWNGEKGSYINSNSFELEDSDGITLTPVSEGVEEGSSFGISTEDIREMRANIQVSETGTQPGLFKYIMDYESPDLETAAAFSLTRDDSVYENILTAAVWNLYKTYYLQIPTVVPDGYTNYQDWAPLVDQAAQNWNDSMQTVFGQAYSNMLKFENYTFDENMWLGQQLDMGNMARPDPYVDYNNWFLERGSGVSLHFASTYTIINRLQGIPTRVVIGYIAGNDSYVYGGKRAVSSRFLHAWAEVLVPIDVPLQGSRVEWFSFDPLLSYLADQYGFDLPTDAFPTPGPEQSVFLRDDYDLETNGIVGARLDQEGGAWIFNRMVVNGSGLEPSPYTLHHGDNITLSTRLVAVPSLNTWMPYMNESIDFYIGTVAENTSGNIEDVGYHIGSALTDNDGKVRISFIIDITEHGIRTVNFYAVVLLGDSQDVRRLAITLPYVITF